MKNIESKFDEPMIASKEELDEIEFRRMISILECELSSINGYSIDDMFKRYYLEEELKNLIINSNYPSVHILKKLMNLPSFIDRDVDSELFRSHYTEFLCKNYECTSDEICFGPYDGRTIEDESGNRICPYKVVLGAVNVVEYSDVDFRRVSFASHAFVPKERIFDIFILKSDFALGQVYYGYPTIRDISLYDLRAARNGVDREAIINYLTGKSDSLKKKGPISRYV